MVFVILVGTRWEGYGLAGVYSTVEKADEAARALPLGPRQWVDRFEIRLDGPPAERRMDAPDDSNAGETVRWGT